MTTHRNLLAGAFCLAIGLAGSALLAFPAGQAEAAATQVAGTIVLTIQLTTALPNGTSVSVSPLISPNDAVYSDGTAGTSSATVSSGKANFSIRIPYSWRVSSTADKVSIAADVSGYGSTSSTNVSASTYFSSTIALPANGATTTIAYSGTL